MPLAPGAVGPHGAGGVFRADTVLATNVEGASGVIRQGEEGLLMPVDDTAALAAAARQIFGDMRLRVKLALVARQRFVEEFSQSAVLAAWLEVLQKVAR